MKKVIAGARYDTDSARKLAHWEVGEPVSDLDYYTETLYRTMSGRYFLHGVGGARTPYGKACPSGGWMGGERIVPVTEEQARSMVDEHCNADEYEAIFSSIEEGLVKRTFYISPAACARLDALKEFKRLPANQVVDKAILAYYADEAKAAEKDGA